ncbi:transposase [Limosilactobacillus fermentum]|uniref:transposase n=1 Tax=Limosilactobacillus fermentum TaxID=1613 RepID=UPI0021AC6C9A|nr:transposase [Limosilactobacillus fermentum]UVF14336.1 transposase [Limosilactobacillus fermentum]
MTKHSYDKEFKEQAVQYYLDNKDHMTMNEISKNLGIGARDCLKTKNSGII